MSSINKVILTGHVGQDPEVKVLDSGVKVANFSLASSHPYKNKAGEKVDQTFWHKIVVFKGHADVVEKYVKKGSHIALEGQLRSRVYDDKEGKKHTIVEVYANQIQLLGSKPEGSSTVKEQQQAETAPWENNSPVAENDYTGGTDDLPF